MTEQLTEPLPQEQDAPAQPAGPTRVSWATVPRVNLLPVTIIEGRRLRRTKQLLGLMVFVGVLIAGAGTYLAQREVSAAKADLSTAQSQVVALQSEVSKYSAVPAVVSQVEAAQAARTEVMGQDVLWYQFMTDLAGALPAGVTQDSITVSLAPKTQTSAPGATALNPAGVGTLTISGNAQVYQEISAWLDALSKVNGVSSPALTSAAKSVDNGASVVKYSITAVVSDAAFSHRYDKEGS